MCALVTGVQTCALPILQTLQSPGSNGSAFLCNQDLGQVLNLVFFPDRVIEVEHQPATDEAPRRIAGDRQIVRCEPVGAFWGENAHVLTLELGPDCLTLNYQFENVTGDHSIPRTVNPAVCC